MWNVKGGIMQISQNLGNILVRSLIYGQQEIVNFGRKKVFLDILSQ